MEAHKLIEPTRPKRTTMGASPCRAYTMVAHTCHQRVVRLRRLRAWDEVRLRPRAGVQVTFSAERFSLVCDQAYLVYRMQPSTISMARAAWYMAYVVYNQGCLV